MSGRQDAWNMAGAPGVSTASGRASISYERSAGLNGHSGGYTGFPGQQYAGLPQPSVAAYLQQQQQQQQQHLRQQHEQLEHEQHVHPQTRPDMSEFPSLGNPPGLASAAQQQAAQLYRSIARSADRAVGQGQGQRPSLTADDFPALAAASTADMAPGAALGEAAGDEAEHMANGLEKTSVYKPPTANLVRAAGAQGPIGASDRFGMLGILATNEYGFDVAKFGLPLPSAGKLYATFGSPWTDQSQAYGLIEPDYKLPACYNASRPQPASTKMAAFTDETLFYIFYTMPRDKLQLAAAEELFRRQWRYHKELRVWLTKDPDTPSTAHTPRGEQGVFVFFDPGVWQKVKKEFVVYYDHLEDRGAVAANAEAAGVAFRAGAQSVPPSLQQQQMLMLRQQQESLQAARGMSVPSAYSAAQMAEVAAASMPPQPQPQPSSSVSQGQLAASVAEDVAAAPMA
ncbi:transcriptional regulator [Coemansia sp. Benny D115]|nr:transcriptional regulator [Coemansia sp. Benny D115]